MQPLTETLITIGLVSTAVLLVVMAAVAALFIIAYVIKTRASNIISSGILIAKGSFDEAEPTVAKTTTRGLSPASIESAVLTQQEQESWMRISRSLRDEEF